MCYAHVFSCMYMYMCTCTWSVTVGPDICTCTCTLHVYNVAQLVHEHVHVHGKYVYSTLALYMHNTPPCTTVHDCTLYTLFHPLLCSQCLWHEDSHRDSGHNTQQQVHQARRLKGNLVRESRTTGSRSTCNTHASGTALTWYMKYSNR